jgi:hypothetical protein
VLRIDHQAEGNNLALPNLFALLVALPFTVRWAFHFGSGFLGHGNLDIIFWTHGAADGSCWVSHRTFGQIPKRFDLISHLQTIWAGLGDGNLLHLSSIPYFFALFTHSPLYHLAEHLRSPVFATQLDLIAKHLDNGFYGGVGFDESSCGHLVRHGLLSLCVFLVVFDMIED